MKKTRKFRLFTVLIALCMLVGTIPAYAVNPYGSLTLTFTSEEDIDLGGIEISVYQAAPATVTETYTLYNETFHSTVTTDQNGSVTFAKPSQYCSITVELDSLPDGVGITKQTKFFNPDVTEQTIILATVDRAETELSGTEVKPTFYSADNVQLLADYEVVKSNNAYATMPWESINAMDSFSLSGAFVDGNMSIPYSIPVDISEANVAEKYTTLYDYGMISERDMILAQCDILSKPENSYMRTPEIVSTIEKYRDKLLAETVPMDSNVAAIFDAPIASPDLVLTEEALAYDSTSDDDWRSQTVIASGTHAIVYSNLTSEDGISASELSAFANAIVSEMNNIHYYFVTTVGFDPPESPTEVDGKMAIEIVNDSHRDGEGRTMLSVYGRTYSDGYILLNYDLRYDTSPIAPERWITTLAHEYQHAIQNSYATGYKDSWLSESTANFASAMYAKLAFSTNNKYRDRTIRDHWDAMIAYQNSPALSLNKVNNGRHYSLLFPAYLFFNTGLDGWDTIKEIYETSFGRPITATPDTYIEIDQALREINTTYSFKSIFENFAIDTLFSKSVYGTLYDSYYDEVWPSMAQNYISAESAIPSSTCAVDPVATIYNAITDAPDSEIAVTINIHQGNYSDLVIWALTQNNSLEKTDMPPNPIDPIRYVMSGSRITIQHQHGSPNPFNVITINTNYYNDVRYTITISS